jgi:hypothetical protein
MKIGVGSAWVTFCRVAALADKRHLSDKELRMVAAVDFMTVQAVLRNRRMFKCIGSSLFSMAIVAKIIY